MSQPPQYPGSGGPSYPGSGGPGYPGAGYPGAGYPGTHDPVTGLPWSDKSKVVAGVLQIVLGGFGVGRFYTGHHGMAVLQLVVTLVTCGLGSIWGVVDGIMILVNNTTTDAQGRLLRP
jgi:TM2 domain-containing membrane protein YozV